MIDFTASAKLCQRRYGKHKRSGDHREFETLAQAIRFAVEELPAALLVGTYIEAGQQRFDGNDIRALYECSNYPLREARIHGEPDD